MFTKRPTANPRRPLLFLARRGHIFLVLSKAPTAALTAAVLVGLLFLTTAQQGVERSIKPDVHRRRQPAKPRWSAVAAFSGTAPQQTASFKVVRGPWRLRWQVDGPPNSASVGFTVFSKNPALPPIREKHGLLRRKRGAVTIKESGTFYLLVSSFEADWSFVVEKRMR